MNQEFWRGKRVFITGHTGFKGSWLVLLLNRMGATIAGYALAPPTQPSLFELAKLQELVPTVPSDIRDIETLRRELLKFSPTVVIHMAAQSVVLRSYSDPVETYATNVMGTVNLLQAVRELNGRCVVVNVTTDKVYENRNWAWGYREVDRLGGRDPYSNSKACSELVAQAFRDSFFKASAGGEIRVALGCARAGNVIGGGDWTPRQLVPDTIAALNKGHQVVLRHPESTRPWQHVLDCLSGYLALAEALARNAERYSGSWNFGPTDVDTQPVSRVVEMLAGYWGEGNPWRRDPDNHPHEESDLRLNSQLANRELNWRGRLSLEHALGWTADWYRGHSAGANALGLCNRQVDSYLGL